MPVSNPLRRLLHVRKMEEEQRRLDLEAALGELHALEHGLAAARAREHRARRLLNESAGGEIADRAAALLEGRAAARIAAVLRPRIAAAESAVGRTRQAFLDKRIERRQAETLIQEAEARDAAQAGRRSQQTLDERFGAQLHRSGLLAVKRPNATRATTGLESEPAKVRTDARPAPANLEQKSETESPRVPDSGTVPNS